MTKLLIALCLTVAAQASFAQGFSPWQDRVVRHEMTSGTAASVAPTGFAPTGFAPTGFAPWRDRETVIEMPSTAAPRMGDAFGSAFRPWS